ncbi:MAG TPA: restriction endonuclease subunit S [Smithella sp.]|nr:restriction endonuclease subunit S [Smithella sp.]
MVEAMEIQKGFKKTEVGVIPNDWKLLPVSKFGEVKRGAGSQYIKYVNYNGIRFIRINDFFEDSPVYVSPTVDMMRFAITESDVLFAGTGASAGASYIPKKEWIGLPHSYNAPRIRTNENHSKEFLLHTLQSEYIAKQQRAWFVGAAQPFLDLNAISNFLIATPPTKTEQTAIAEVLNDADALITELEKLIAKKKAIKQGAMQELLKPKADWEVKKLGEIAEFFKGKGLPKSNLVADGSIKCIHYGELFLQYKEDITNINNRTNEFEGAFYSKINDVLMPTSDVTPRGLATASCLKEDGVLLGGDILVIRIPKQIANGSFLSHYIRLNRNEVMKLVKGVTVYHLHASDMKDYCFKYPNIEEQNNTAKVLFDMENEIEKLEELLCKYKMLKQGMMQNLLTGKIRLI